MAMKKNTGVVEGTKPGWNWRESHVLFLVVPALCLLLVPWGVFSYLCGRMGLHLATAACVVYLVVGLFMIYCFANGVGQLFEAWKRRRTKKKTLIVAQISIPAMFALLFILLFLRPVRLPLWPDAIPYTYGFRDRIRSKADIPAIRAWLKNLSEDEYSKPGDHLAREKWPKALKELKPPRVYVCPDDRRNPYVRITWGGGFSHWGIIIGSKELAIAESELDFSFDSWLPVEPGVYVYDW
jgi:hypothetical protein